MPRGFTYDSLLNLKVAGAITANTAGSLIIDTNQGATGPASRFDAIAVIDVAAMDVADANETYDIVIQLSNSPTFASGVVNKTTLPLGIARFGSSAASTIGRHELAFDNELAEIVYRYVRIYTGVGGTTPSINYKAFASLQPNGL